MEQDQKHYYAFISHSSADVKIAKWLCKQLERYHIPTAIQKEYHAPKHLKPIFLYEIDLSKNVLKSALESELIDSQYLIVICSPKAAKSSHVNDEVRHFIDSGRYDKIIPFIIDGTPFASLNGDAENECFPPALVALKGTEQELRGIDIREEQKHRGSKKAAIVDVIATMLGVRMDVLWDKYKRRKMKQIIFVFVLLLCSLFLSVLVYSRMKTISEYYEDYTLQRGLPVGIKKLSADDIKNRRQPCVFEYKRSTILDNERKLRKVYFYDNITHHISQYKTYFIEDITGLARKPIINVEYENGELCALSLCDEHNKEIMKYSYEFSHQKNHNTYIADISYHYNEDFSIEAYGGFKSHNLIRRVKYQTDNAGYITKITFHGHNGALSQSIMPDANGLHGYVIERDNSHRITKISGIDKNGNICESKTGVAIITYAYSDRREKSMHHYDKHLNPKLDSHGIFSYSITEDAYGNDLQTTCYDTMGVICANDEGWCIQKEMSTKTTMNFRYFDENEEPTYCKQGYHHSKIQFLKRKNTIRVIFYDANEKEINSKGGFAITERVYDRKDNLIKISFYNAKNKLTLNKDHYAYETRKYKKNRCVEVIYYDTTGKKVNTSIGVCKISFTYDPSGYPIERRYYNTKDEPIISKKEGCACIRSHTYYDDYNHRVVEQSYWGVHDEPVINNVNYTHKDVSVYDERGNLLEWSIYGKDGELTLGKTGYAIVRFMSDEYGRMVKREYFDCDNKLCKNFSQVAIDSFVYISNDHYIAYFLDTNRELHKGYSGYAIVENEKRGDSIICRYYDSDRVLCQNGDGYAISVTRVKQNGNVISSAFYDQFHQPTNNYESVHRADYLYDNHGNVVTAITYDKNNNIVIIEREYDKRDNKLSEKYFDANHKATIPPQFSTTKAHGILTKYDERDRMIEQSFIGVDSQCVMGDIHNRIACAIFKYDDRDNLIERCYLDTNRELTEDINGAAIDKYFYNDHDLPTMFQYYDSDTLPVLWRNQFFARELEYNELGLATKEVFYDTAMSYMGRIITYYTPYGVPGTVLQYNNKNDLVGNGVNTPIIIEDITNITPDNQYLILRWEEWSIIDGLNPYLSYLMQSRSSLAKDILIVNHTGKAELIHFDAKSEVSMTTLPKEVYDQFYQAYLYGYFNTY